MEINKKVCTSQFIENFNKIITKNPCSTKMELNNKSNL